MATDQIVDFGDAEADVITVLNADFATWKPALKAATRNAPIDEYIKVTRVGGPAETLVTENAQILLESYALLEVAAIANLSRARAVLRAQYGEPLFGCTEIGGPINQPDPTTSKIRYTQVVGVRRRGTVSA